MALQGTVNQVPAIGMAGQEVVAGQAAYLSYQVLSDGTIVPGGFVFAATASGNGEVFAYASGTGSSGDSPVGLAVRTKDAMIANVLESYTAYFPAGAAVTVALRGQFYAEVPEDVTATDGQSVYVNPTTGAINFGTSAGTDEVDTGWTVRIPNGGTSAAAGEIVIVERY